MKKDSTYRIFIDKRKRTWEIFVDESYYGLICVRCIDCGKDLNSHMSFHFINMEEAESFATLVENSQ